MHANLPEPLATEHDLYALPEDGRRHELLAGRVVSEPRPAFDHGALQAWIAHLLLSFVLEHRLGRVTTESGFVLSRNPDTVRGPDVAFVSVDQLRTQQPAPGRFFPGAPDLAVEIVSPSNRPEEIHARVADFLAAGTRLVWVCDPASRTVTTYRSLLAPRRLATTATLEGEDVLPGFAVAVEALFDLQGQVGS